MEVFSCLFITQEQSFYHEFSFNIFDNGIQNKFYIVFFFQYVYQITLSTEFVPAMYNVNFIAVVGKKLCILQSRISSTDHRYIFPAEKCTVTGCTVRNSGSCQCFLLWDPQMSVRYSCCNHDCFTWIFFLVCHDDFDPVFLTYFFYTLGSSLCSQLHRLIQQIHRILTSADTLQSRIILYFR